MRIAAPAARFAMMNLRAMSLIVLLQILDQGLELLDVLGGELPVLGEVSDHGRELAAEQPVEKALALLGDIIGAGDQRPVDVAGLFLFPRDSLLREQAMDERAHRARRPAILLADRRDDLFG